MKDYRNVVQTFQRLKRFEIEIEENKKEGW